MARKRRGFEYYCRDCNEPTVVSAANSVVRYFKRQPWLSFLEFFCESCKELNRAFFGPDDWEAMLHKLAESTAIGFVSESFADDEVTKAFAQVYELPLLREHGLNQTEEALVAFFAYLLERGETPWMAM